MPVRLSPEFVRICEAFGIVMLATGPVVLGLWLITRRRNAIAPPWQLWRNHWTGFDALALWLLALVQPLIALAGVPAILLAIPACWLAFLALQRITGAEPTSRPDYGPRFFPDTVFTYLVWLLITPITFGVYFLAQWWVQWSGGVIEQHPLTEQVGWLVFVKACLLAPVVEELAFRRILVPWSLVASYRSWLIVLIAVVFPLLRLFGSDDALVAPLEYWGILVAGFIGVRNLRRVWRRAPVRVLSTIYATAVLFSLAHSVVWPTPIPLFVLGLGLGYVMVRTRSLWPCVLLHALFNAVSALYLLRGVG